MKHRINLRLGLIALIAVIMTATGLTLIYYELFQAQVRKDLGLSAELLVETEIFQSAYGARAGQEKILKNLDVNGIRITWVDGDGTVLFDNDTDIQALSNHMDRPEIQDALKYGKGESTRKSATVHMNTFYYALLLENGTILRVSTTARTISSVFLTAFPVIIVIAIFVLTLCLIIGHFLTRQLIKPIEDMAEHIDDNRRDSAYKELEPFARKIRSQHENILAAAKSRQDFTASISHELKTPITAISGYAELIENHMIDEQAEVHIAQKIRQNADRLLSIITDIIQLSELDHKELPRNFESADLLQITKQSVQELQPLAAKANIQLSCEGISAGIMADKALIREMIDNLVQNAIRYNKPQGSVKVNVTIYNGHPQLTVKDTGIGIPEGQQDRVFERFYRVDKSRSRQTGGTGLGLAIVKHIVEIHSAEISLESKQGVGTEITVSF